MEKQPKEAASAAAADTSYDFKRIEQTAQQTWKDQQCFKASDSAEKEKFYCLAMFPYPSGKLHMGHVRNYSLSDVISRFQRMLGKKVLQPMGWDAFGLPAENAAMKQGVAPNDWTQENIDYMRHQLKQLGFAYDWDRELATSDPSYYRWEQWFFIQLYEKGLVYKKDAEVNWDPVDQTVLANEQVIEGRGWRSGALVEKRSIPQWFIKITDYAQQLLDDLTQLDAWPEQVKAMQRNWIGRSEGTLVKFKLKTTPEPTDLNNISEHLSVFTTRADTLFGVTYLAVAPQHPISLAAAKDNPKICDFIASCAQLKTAESEIATLEKAGVQTQFEAIHPITQESIPIWVANFVLMSYGEGAVMAVPAHDQRDFEFAKTYQINIKTVIEPAQGEPHDFSTSAFTEAGILINSGSFSGLSSTKGKKSITEYLASERLGEKRINFRLRDWGVSRQRYWGTPIPMIHCDDCGCVPVPLEDLPVTLPTKVSYDEQGGSPIKKMPSFYEAKCPKCQKDARRETDTFDTFMESSWYYARFCCPTNDERMLDEMADHWCPVDQYVGGIEHAILHLLYARFFHKLMRDLGLVHSNEPFNRLLCQGMVTAQTFYDTNNANGTKRYYAPDQVDVKKDAKGRVTEAYLKTTQQPIEIGPIEKMSKSKNNGTDPQSLIETYGADTLRLFIIFAAPPDQSLEWSEAGVAGAHRFIKRLHKITQTLIATMNQSDMRNFDFKTMNFTSTQKKLRKKTHTTLKKVRDDYERRQNFNTAISAVMELLNEIQAFKTDQSQDLWVKHEAIEHCVMMLNPVIPHLCHHLWLALGHDQYLIDQPWPKPDESACLAEDQKIMIQVNGKLRGHILVSTDADKTTIESQAQTQEGVQKFTNGKTIKKIIHVPNKLINIVVA